MKRIYQLILKLLIQIPFHNRLYRKWYSLLGIKLCTDSRISYGITVIGSYSNIELGSNTEINTGCFLLAKNKIKIGKNSTLAFQTTILTSANPNGPKNLLCRVYQKMTAPVIIGDNTWIGARAVILPGITIGNFCVVAAGAVVTKDVPDYTVVAGVPAKKVKELDQKIFEN